MSLYKDVQKATARKQGVDVKEPAEVTMSNILDGPIKRPDESKLFKTVEERCADARSTAMTLLLVGILGLAAMILAITGSLQLPLPKIAPYSMSVLFLAFIAVAVVLIQKSKKIMAEGPAEHARIRTIKNWFETDGISSEEIVTLPVHVPVTELETLYRKKYEAIKTVLHKHFPEEDGQLLDKLAADFSEDARIDAMLEEQVRIEAAAREKRTS